jgi:hypothetical protein
MEVTAEGDRRRDGDIILLQEDLMTLELKNEDAGDRNKWRRRIRVADSSP